MQAIDLEENPSLSGEFLMEQISLRESLDAAEKSGDPQVIEDFIAEIEGDSEQVAKAFGELFESKAYDEALQRVYQLQFLKKLMQSARAAEDRLLGY
jgi:DnaJ-domain-containing protein 1